MVRYNFSCIFYTSLQVHTIIKKHKEKKKFIPNLHLSPINQSLIYSNSQMIKSLIYNQSTTHDLKQLRINNQSLIYNNEEYLSNP